MDNRSRLGHSIHEFRINFVYKNLVKDILTFSSKKLRDGVKHVID